MGHPSNLWFSKSCHYKWEPRGWHGWQRGKCFWGKNKLDFSRVLLHVLIHQRGLVQISCESAIASNLILFCCSIKSEWGGDNHLSETWSGIFSPTWLTMIGCDLNYFRVKGFQKNEKATRVRPCGINLYFQSGVLSLPRSSIGKSSKSCESCEKLWKVVKSCESSEREKVCQCHLGWETAVWKM